MTKLGKLLVLLNLVFSFFVMAWALNLFANRVDWSDQKAQGDQPAGELATRQARIDELWAAVRPAESAWREPRGVILALEKQRPEDRTWYAAEFLHIRSGADANKPGRKVVFDRGVPAVDLVNANRPKMEPAKDRKEQPLQALTFNENELNAARDSLVSELKKHTDLVDEDTKLTIRLVGKLDPETKRLIEKGLRQRIIDEREKYQDLEKEQELTKPMLINAFVESQLILKRAEALKARIDELARRTGDGVAVDR